MKFEFFYNRRKWGVMLVFCAALTVSLFFPFPNFADYVSLLRTALFTIAGVALSVFALRRLLWRGPIIVIDAKGIFDGRWMSKPIPWDVISNIHVPVETTEELFGTKSSADKVEIHTKALLPYAKHLSKNWFLRGWWRYWDGYVAVDQEKNIFSIDFPLVSANVDAVISAMAAAGPGNASQAYIRYLQAQKSPERTAERIDRELGKEFWWKVDSGELLATVSAALSGPLSPISEGIVKRMVARIVDGNPTAVSFATRMHLNSESSEMKWVGVRLNKALVDIGQDSLATETEIARISELAVERDAKPDFRSRLRKAMLYLAQMILFLFVFPAVTLTAFFSVGATSWFFFDCRSIACLETLTLWTMFSVCAVLLISPIAMFLRFVWKAARISKAES